jgi:hypothetical protein
MASPAPPALRRREPVRGGWRAVAAAGVAALLLCACATVSDSGPVQAGKVALTVGGQNPGYLQLIPVPPKPGWTAVQVVEGFLAACASFANHHAVAREYLDPAKRRTWNPGWAVTVVGAPKVGPSVNLAPHSGAPYSQEQQVNVTGEKLATLTDTGQYRGNTGQHRGAAGSSTYSFRLFKIAGQWRIDNPPGRLLLTDSDFKRVYAPRNLYYVASPSPASQRLVPDPVFVPLQATSAALANKLVTALLQRPKGWLKDAVSVSTAFPPGARLLRATLNDGTATINLGGKAARAGQGQLSSMISQMVWTLAGHSYGPSAVQAVELEINGYPRLSASLSDGRLALSVPEEPANLPLYSLSATRAVQERTPLAPTPRNVPGEVGAGHVRLTSIAVSPPPASGRYVAGFTATRKVVYYGPIRRGARLTPWRVRGGGVTSLSWDIRGNLWVASPRSVWMLPSPAHGVKRNAVQLGLGLRSGSVVSQLLVAPDGVRVAIIVHGPGWDGNHLLLAAIGQALGGAPTLGTPVSIGTDVRHPTQLTWYDADHLIVLSRSHMAPQLWEVPVNGGSSTALVTDSGTQSITAAGPANPLAAGLAEGHLDLESNLNGTPVLQRGTAGSPVYPG